MYKKVRLLINPGEKLTLVLRDGKGFKTYKFMEEGDNWLELGYATQKIRVEPALMSFGTGESHEFFWGKMSYYVLDRDTKTLRRAVLGHLGSIFHDNFAKPILISDDTEDLDVQLRKLTNGYVELHSIPNLLKQGAREYLTSYVVDLRGEYNKVHETRLVVLG